MPEVAGALGDLGTFLPLLIGLVQKVGLDLGTTLILTGLYNIISGVQFGIPMCVQPMKTIAAVALSSAMPALALSQLLLAGIFVSGCVLLLGASRLIDLFNWLVPGSVVRGVQLGVGAKLAMKGLDMALRQHGRGPMGQSVAVWRPWLGSEGLLLGAVALALLVATTIARRPSPDQDDDAARPRPVDTPLEPLLRRLLPAPASAPTFPWSLRGRRGTAAAAPAADGDGDGEAGGLLGGGDDNVQVDDAGTCGHGHGGGGGRVPSALIAVVVGLVLVVAGQPKVLSELKFGPSTPHLLHPSWSDLREGVRRAGLAQLPLTTLNSVIAVTQLADYLYPGREDSRRWRPSAVAMSVGLMNLVGCWLGAMPCCHGAGGLAAQHKFGARSGAAPMLLGSLKLALGLLFGSSLLALLARFPQPLLGAMLTVSGVELAASVRMCRSARSYTYALLTAAAILGLDDTGVGFLLGVAAVAAVALYEAAAGAGARFAASPAAGAWRQRLGAVFTCGACCGRRGGGEAYAQLP